jgi:hypothetical protein
MLIFALLLSTAAVSAGENPTASAEKEARWSLTTSGGVYGGLTARSQSSFGAGFVSADLGWQANERWSFGAGVMPSLYNGWDVMATGSATYWPDRFGWTLFAGPTYVPTTGFSWTAGVAASTTTSWGYAGLWAAVNPSARDVVVAAQLTIPLARIVEW